MISLVVQNVIRHEANFQGLLVCVCMYVSVMCIYFRTIRHTNMAVIRNTIMKTALQKPVAKLYCQSLQKTLEFFSCIFALLSFSSFLYCHFRSFSHCLFQFLLLASFKASPFNFTFVFLCTFCLFLLLSLIR
jgi:hypothetical protein